MPDRVGLGPRPRSRAWPRSACRPPAASRSSPRSRSTWPTPSATTLDRRRGRPPRARARARSSAASPLIPRVWKGEAAPSWRHSGRTSNTPRVPCGSTRPTPRSCIATLTLGIGANAAIFSVADAVMLRPYPYPDMDRIVMLNETTRAAQPQQMSVAWPTFQDWQAQNQSFEHLGIYRNAVVNLTGGDPAGAAERGRRLVGVVRGDGRAPVAGRVFGRRRRIGRTRRAVALISERLWRGRFNADASAGRPRARPEQRAARRGRHDAAGDALSVAAHRRLAAARTSDSDVADIAGQPSRLVSPSGSLKPGVPSSARSPTWTRSPAASKPPIPDTNKDVAVGDDSVLRADRAEHQADAVRAARAPSASCC